MLEEMKFQPLAAALRAIPVPVKAKEPGIGAAGVVEREVITSVRVKHLVAIMAGVDPTDGQDWRHLLAALAVLKCLGLVDVDAPLSSIPSSVEEMSVRATSEPAGYVLQELSRLLASPSDQMSPVRPDSRVAPFASMLREAIARDRINPHLVLANILALGRKDAERDGVRHVRNICVLIKAGWSVASSDKEPVYLHTYKPQYGGYALVGSVPAPGWDDEATARFALREDLATPAHRFTMQPSGVDDAFDVRLTVSRGTYSHYAFNLFVVTAIDGDLEVREGVTYNWFTFSEMCACLSDEREAILPKGGLLEKLRLERGLDWIPVVVLDAEPDLDQSIRSEAAAALGELRRVVRAARRLLRLVALRIARAWRCLATLLLLLLVLFLLRPILDRQIAGLGNLASFLTVLMFVASVFRAALR